MRGFNWTRRLRSLSPRRLKASKNAGRSLKGAGIQGCLSRERALLLVGKAIFEPMSNATVLLTAVERGDPKAADELLELVYQELRQLATRKMAQESPGHTLQPTALVHEAWLRLVGSEHPNFENRTHFFSAAAEAMRRILIDRARRRSALRHGGQLSRADLDEAYGAAPESADEMLEVHRGH